MAIEAAKGTDEAAAVAAAAVAATCGCYVTKSAERFFPLHEAMRAPDEFVRTGEHADACRALIEDLASAAWPPKKAYTAQYWTVRRMRA